MNDRENTTVATTDAQSSAYGVSVRAWLALFLVWTACAEELLGRDPSPGFAALVVGAVGWYFGQRDKAKT